MDRYEAPRKTQVTLQMRTVVLALKQLQKICATTTSPLFRDDRPKKERNKGGAAYQRGTRSSHSKAGLCSGVTRNAYATAITNDTRPTLDIRSDVNTIGSMNTTSSRDCTRPNTTRAGLRIVKRSRLASLQGNVRNSSSVTKSYRYEILVIG